ncbi:dTDP-4-dehydrorhamnose 3,5-epimerase [Anaerorhabdus furcosa]|uniref:dTDP-4-dehydrorhamnose 3,5-epimerase n=1 Tax=Anaerorhabdus furcosa TaxID=118967 RepID=A0A1T4ND85_9FIRM|nr:dTDP-4-dehydrorhamnose 3,5-epimerase [Anaerorhabdus furcosa]SJZ77073.1 dTDP-4-dehydrorhamnose 3,5-epimerase [Anaerorhabdus furcosa]
MKQLSIEKNPNNIEGLIVIKPRVFLDERGYFCETYNKSVMYNLGVNIDFVQDNESLSTKGVLRGLHFQKKFSQAKLVRVIQGSVFDVAVDIRSGSPTYGKYFGIELTSENHFQLYIPKGFAHGFVALSDEAIFSYKCTDFYHPEDEGGLLWNDEEIAIDWPISIIDEIIVSEKDKKHPTFKEFKEGDFKFF